MEHVAGIRPCCRNEELDLALADEVGLDLSDPNADQAR
jgi:hypothetical protein